MLCAGRAIGRNEESIQARLRRVILTFHRRGVAVAGDRQLWRARSIAVDMECETERPDLAAAGVYIDFLGDDVIVNGDAYSSAAAVALPTKFRNRDESARRTCDLRKLSDVLLRIVRGAGAFVARFVAARQLRGEELSSESNDHDR